jgi:hypothetical protein
VLAKQKITNKRLNKITIRLESENQNNYVYIAGLLGYMKVKHR